MGPDKFLEDYTLLDQIGQGGFATVYKVRHSNLGYIRAVRVLNATIAREKDETYQKFLEECRLLLRLGNGNHPNIVHIYQPLLKAQKAIVEMDYVDGKDLYHYLEERSSFVEINDVMKLLNDISSALAYCHEDIYQFCMDKDEDNIEDDPEDGSKPLLNDEIIKRLIRKYRVIHNDIHSGNIIRRNDGSFVLLDFGLAIDGSDVIRSSRTQNGGAPEFKAPEKWANERLLTTQSDVYSFGVVLYEFLAGRVPFVFDKKNSNAIEAVYLLSKDHLEKTPPPIFELRKAAFEASHPGEVYEQDYPDWLEALIMKCLSKAPEDRFKSGKDLHNFVVEHTAQEAIKLNDTISMLQGKIDSLEKTKKDDEKKSQEEITKAQEKVVSLEHKVDTLSKEVKTLRENGANTLTKPKKRWKILSLFLAITTCCLFVYSFYGSRGDKDTVDLQNQLKEAQNSITEMNNHLTQLENTKTELEQTVAAKDEKIAQLESQIKQQANNTELNEKIRNLNQQIKKLNSKIDAQKKTINAKQKEINVLKNKLNEKL